MRFDDDTLRGIEDALVSAALEPKTWSKAVEQIVSCSGARGAGALPLRGRVPGIPISPSCDDLMAAYFGGGWVERDHRVTGLPKLMQSGLLVDQDISTPEFMRRSPYYTDFLGRHGFQWFAGLLVNVGEDAWCLTLQRTQEQGMFTPDEQAALRRLTSPLNRAARLTRTLGDARLHGSIDTLEALGLAGFLLDRTGRTMYVNARAERLLGRALDVTQGRLTVQGDRRTSLALHDHIAAAIWVDVRPDDPALKPVVVQRVSHPPLVITAHPLRRAGLEYLHGARAIVTVKDLGEASSGASILFQSTYGLTAREMELCEALLSGQSVAECADALGMSVNTARTHLKRIMAKTETRRQGELLMLLGRYRRG